MKRHGLALLIVALLLAGCTSTRQGPAGSRSAPELRLPIGRSAHNLTVDGLERTYSIYRPATLPTTGPAPLVVVLHGAAGTGAQAENTYGWDAEAERGRFLVAYPDGVQRAWAVSDGCCGAPARAKVDDVHFIETMVSAIGGDATLDRRRVYATGISNGGLLAYRLACDTTLFAAIGPVAATMINPCPKPAPISVLHIHGTADDIIPYGGGPGRLSNDGTGPRPVQLAGPPVPQLIATWRGIDRCGAAQETTHGLVSTSVATCPGGRSVQLISITGAGHQWPGSVSHPLLERLLHLPPPSKELQATPVLWQFFAAHPRPS